MKNLIHNLNKAFENRIRLGIMSVLMVNQEVDFNRLKELIEVTDGNLASHLKSLEDLQYIEIEKKFVGRKPNTQYRASKTGIKAFQDHLKALEEIIQKQNNQN